MIQLFSDASGCINLIHCIKLYTARKYGKKVYNNKLFYYSIKPYRPFLQTFILWMV